MTDLQLLTIVVSLVIPLSMLLYGNSRITDTKETLRAEILSGNSRITDTKKTLRAEIQALRAEMKADRVETNAHIKDLRDLIERNQDTIMRLLADIDQRVTRLEERG